MQALVRGFTCAGVAIREEHRAPYQSLRAMFRELIPLANEVGRSPRETQVLHRMMPPAFQSEVSKSSLTAVSPHDERGILIQEASAWLHDLSQVRPLLLLSDDLQWCDESSLLVLRAVSRNMTKSRVVLVGAFRADELLDGSDLDQWLHQEHVQVVEAPRFDETQMSEFVNGLLGRHSLGNEFMRRAATITEGTPFFTIELLRDLIDQNLLMRRAGVWQAVGDDFRLPESVSRLIERRIGRLGPLSREMCLQLAVAGGHLSLATLVELFDLDETELLRACDELVGHRIGEIREDDVRLIHDSLRERIYQTATDHEREEYHQRLGSYLERTLPGDAFDRSSAVGYHLSRGRDRIRGLGYLEDAGLAAFHREEHGVARNLLMDADHLLTNLPDVEDRDTRQYAVRKMLTFVCVSNDYVLGAEVGEWVYQHAIARSLSSLPVLQRFLPDPLPYLFVLGVELPLRMLRHGMKALRQFESDVGDIFLATGYLCNCLASMMPTDNVSPTRAATPGFCRDSQ